MVQVWNIHNLFRGCDIQRLGIVPKTISVQVYDMDVESSLDCSHEKEAIEKLKEQTSISKSSYLLQA